MIAIILFVLLIAASNAYMSPMLRNRGVNSLERLFARRNRGQNTEVVEEAPSVVYGVDIPDEVAKNSCIYDMVLIERMSAPLKTSAGILLPLIEGKDQKKVGIVLSKATNYGLESEQGRLQPIEDIAPYNVGDLVYIQVRLLNPSSSRVKLYFIGSLGCGTERNSRR